jgi:hypothetical protein
MSDPTNPDIVVRINDQTLFREFVGHKLKGVLFDVLPDPSATGQNTVALVYDDGRGLLLYESGTFGLVEADAVKAGVRARKQALKAIKEELDTLADMPDTDPTDTP